MSHAMRSLALGAAAAVLAGCYDAAPTSPAAARTARVVTPNLIIPSLTRQARTLTAAGGKPTRSPVPDAANTFDIPAGLACSFELAGEPVVNNEVVTTFPADANGDVVQLITGRLVERLTNVSTGESITVNISGPGRFTHHTDGSTTLESWGPWFNVLFPNAIPPGPRAFLSWGRLVLNFTPSGQAILVSLSGRTEDVCAALS